LEPSLLKRLHADIEIELNPGSHRLPLFKDDVLPVDVPRRCRCRATMWAAPPSDRSSPDPMVSALELTFDPPPVLGNILPVLAKLNVHFQDNTLEVLKSKIAALGAADSALSGIGFFGKKLRKRIVEEVESRLPTGGILGAGLEQLKSGLKSGSEQLVKVSLRHVSARPVLRAKGWELDLRFSGEMSYLGRVKVPFEHVRVPDVIIPSPHAMVERLASKDPLATARLRSEHFPADDMLRCIVSMVGAFRGHSELSGVVPDTALQFLMAGGGVFDFVAHSPGLVDAEARFSGQLTPDKVTVELEELDVVLDDGRLGMSASLAVRRRAIRETGSGVKKSVAREWVEAALTGEWPGDNLGLEFDLQIREGSRIGELSLDGRYAHPLLKGGTDALFEISDLELEGVARGAFGLEEESSTPALLDMSFSCGLEVEPGSRFDTGTVVILPETFAARASGKASSLEGREYLLELEGAADFDLAGEREVAGFPELEVEDGTLEALISGRTQFNGRALARRRESGSVEVDFSGTTSETVLARAGLSLGSRSLTLPADSTISAVVQEAVLATSGLGRGEFNTRWDFQGESPVLHGKGQSVVLFVPELRQGEVDVNLSPSGGITVTGEEKGLYDARYFNALLNPEDDLERLLDIIRSDEAMDHVFAAVRVFSEDAWDWLNKLRRFVKKAERIFDEEQISQPKHMIPGRKLARVWSRFLVGTAELEERLYPLVKRVTDGEGVDIPGTKRLLAEVLPPDHGYDFELDRLLRWAANALKPAAPPGKMDVLEVTALAEDPGFRGRFRPLPDAAEVYETVASAEPMPEGFPVLVSRISPYLTLEQVSFILRRKRKGWRTRDRERLKHVFELKKRVRTISRGYGGVGYAPQGLAIAFFLAEIINMSRREVREDDGPLEGVDYPVTNCLLGPQDIAVLLQSGLASALVGRAVQLNQRMLLDLVLEQPPEFLLAVLVELGGNDPRVLAATLNALLDLPQYCLAEPLDLVHEFSHKLGIEFPRLDDFLAGGKRAKLSYYEAISNTAERVLAGADSYRALKFYLQEARRPPGPGFAQTTRTNRLVEQAQTAIKEADAYAQRCKFKGNEPVRRRKAGEGYKAAFKACRRLLTADRCAFQLSWFKKFWNRNHEALVVLSVVRNIQEDVDTVRRWLEVRTGAGAPDDEQQLVDVVIDTLYYYPADRKRLKKDPLVRLLIDPPRAKYDFTVISCMGVVTGGAKGTELEDAYRRLEERLGVTVLRADTATARSLEYNARRVIEAVKKAKTPYGFVGYSQGCANALMTESKLKGGTPEQAGLLDDLVCRNLLFSAANGSAHGTCGDEKFLQAMVDMDHFLAHYQAVFSHSAIRMFLRGVRLVLDSRAFVLGMLGTRSLSHWGVLSLQRGGQFKNGVPTSTVRGVVEPENLPEALEFLANVLTKQLESDGHDTQVAVGESPGHLMWVKNPHTRALKACDTGSLVQRTHHWSPLLKDTEFLTTERDLEQAIYDYPKDRHVFPWIEVNARFGVIKRKKRASS